nr:hypothetical protein CFP56_19378 [Quercus suber]
MPNSMYMAPSSKATVFTKLTRGIMPAYAFIPGYNNGGNGADIGLPPLKVPGSRGSEIWLCGWRCRLKPSYRLLAV